MAIYGKMMIIKKKKFFKTKTCSNDDPFISCNDRIGKMLHNICISAVAVYSGEQAVACGPLGFETLRMCNPVQ